MPTIDRKKCLQLLSGTFGIYITYLAIGLLQQYLLKLPYRSLFNQTQQEMFQSTTSLIFYPHIVTYFIGTYYNRRYIPEQRSTHIPNKNSMTCAFLVLLGGVTFNYAIKWTSYPLVITAKSCGVLSVILVATLCSRVTDKKLKLPKKKIITGIIVSIGILLFKFYDPEIKLKSEEKQYEYLGFVLLIVSMLADGFLPDFQAEIKIKYFPQPTQMMVQINKWVAIYCFVYLMISGDSLTAVRFAFTHQLFGFHLLGMSLLVCCGHFIIYFMISRFKQHIVPFVITSRKVFTVMISLIFYDHRTSIGQIVGILIVLLVVVWQFLSQLDVDEVAMYVGKQVQQGEKFEETQTVIVEEIKSQEEDKQQQNQQFRDGSKQLTFQRFDKTIEIIKEKIDKFQTLQVLQKVSHI